jgi:hypothetical protein
LPTIKHSNRQTTRDISNTVDSAGAMKVGGAATTEVSSYSIFLSILRENATEKTG